MDVSKMDISDYTGATRSVTPRPLGGHYLGKEYPYVQFCTELHTHEWPPTIAFPFGRRETHAHRTYTQFHGHESFPVDRDILVKVIVPGEGQARTARPMGEILDTLEEQPWAHLLHPQIP